MKPVAPAALWVALASSACADAVAVSVAPVHPAMARYGDPTELDGPDYAGCSYVARGASGAVAGSGRFDDRGHLAERVDGGRTVRSGWVEDRDGGRDRTESYRWEDGLLVEVNDSLGGRVEYTYDEDGLRTTDRWFAFDGPVFDATWSWSGDVAAISGLGLAPMSLGFDGDRLSWREVGSDRTDYLWIGEDLAGWTSTGRRVERRLVDGRVEEERRDGVPTRFAWTCP